MYNVGLVLGVQQGKFLHILCISTHLFLDLKKHRLHKLLLKDTYRISDENMFRIEYKTFDKE